MSDLGTMIARIRGDLDRGTDFDDRIRLAILDAIKRYQAKRLGFNTKRAAQSVGTASEYAVLPSDWLEMDFLRAEDNGARFSLDEVSYDVIEDKFGSINARPEVFSIQNRELRLAPIPDKSYSLVVSYLCKLEEVSLSADDTATNAWMTEGEELIRKKAMADLLAVYIDGPESVQKALLLRSECEEDILPALERQAAREQSAGRIRAWL